MEEDYVNIFTQLVQSLQDESKSDSVSHQRLPDDGIAYASQTDQAMTGLKHVPSPILVVLGEKYLNSQELCSFGCTAHWVLNDLIPCKIYAQISFTHVARRFMSSSNLIDSDTSITVPSIPASSYRIGRFTSLRISRQEDLKLWCENSPQLVNMNLAPVKNIQKLEIVVSPEPWLDQSCPIHLPPMLESLTLCPNSTDENPLGCSIGGDIPLHLFILPETLTYIECRSDRRFKDAEHLTTIKWPKNLKTLLNLDDMLPIEGLVLPEGLLQLSFSPAFKQSLATMVLPQSITSLEFVLDANLSLENVKFPPALIRLALQLRFDHTTQFPSFKNLPASCNNLQLSLFMIDKDSYRAPRMNIDIPHTVQQLCIRDADRAWEHGLPKAQFLSDLSSLTTLAIDCQLLPHAIAAITTHGKLKKLRIHPSANNPWIKRKELPATLDELDLSDGCLWDDNCSIPFPPQLKSVKLFRTLMVGLPSSLTSLSMRKCTDDIAMWSNSFASTSHTAASMFPNLRHVDLGHTSVKMLRKWSQQFSQIQIYGYSIIQRVHTNSQFGQSRAQTFLDWDNRWKGAQVSVYLNGEQIREYVIPGVSEQAILARQPDPYDIK